MLAAAKTQWVKLSGLSVLILWEEVFKFLREVVA